MPRKPLHARRIEMGGFLRDDGLYEVEGRVTDAKPYDFVPHSGGDRVPAGTAIHDMGVCLAFDEQLIVAEVRTFTSASPYPACHEGGRALQSLRGMRIGSGWSREVRLRLGGARSCTHLMELLIPLATVAIQTLSDVRRKQGERRDETGRPLKIDSCYAYGAEREIVRMRWPEFHRSPDESP